MIYQKIRDLEISYHFIEKAQLQELLFYYKDKVMKPNYLFKATYFNIFTN